MKPNERPSSRNAWLCGLGFAVSVLLASAPRSSAAEIEGVTFADRVQSSGTALRLQGTALLRYRVLFRGYVGALYLPEDVGPGMLFDDVSKRLEIEYFWAIPANKFTEVTVRGIEANRPDAVERLRPAIAAWNEFYEDVNAGDRYTVTYTPGLGTELARNGNRLGTVPGAEFGAAMFSIWFGEVPFDAGFKDAMLATAQAKP